MADVLPTIEQNLKVCVDQREKTRAIIAKFQEDLQALFAKALKKPRGSIEEFDKTLKNLEDQRTRASLNLSEEKLLLKKINAGERDRRQLQDFLDQDKKIQVKKEQVGELRKVIQPLTDQIAALEKLAARARLAARLGCKVEELEKKEIECPADKLGKVIGKGGANIKKIEEKAGVSLDVDAENNIITINGSLEAFAIAEAEITKIIMATSEDVDVPPSYILYLTNANGNTIVNEMKEANPDVYFDVNRRSKKIPMRGQPADIAKVKECLVNLGVTQQEKEVTSAEAQIIIGKKGSNIQKITTQFMVAIDVEKKEEGASLCIVAGPESEVNAAMKEIEILIESNTEVSKTVPCDKIIAQAFLTSGGVRIKELMKQINESTKELNAGTVILSLDKGRGDRSILIKGKSAAMSTASTMLMDAIRELDADTIHIMADPFVVPQIIGKGGENIRKLQKDKQVNIEVDKSGQVSISGLNKDDVAEVQASVFAILAENKVVKIPLDASKAEKQFTEIIRSKIRNDVRELARLDVDKTTSNLLLRGTDENVQKAADMVKAFLESNFLDSVEITNADRDLLLAGGQGSKIVSLAQELEVNLSVDKAASTIQIRGTEEKVKAAARHINAYLYGGEGNVAIKIVVAKEALGVVIGKGGKTRKTLEAKYADVSLYIHRSSDAITVRGPEEPATDCHNEILKMIARARITQIVPVPEEKMQSLKKSNLVRRLVQHIQVQCTLKAEAIEVRGVAPDVKDAVALFNEHLTGIYESSFELGASQYVKIKGANRDPSHFTRIKDSSGADVSLDDAKSAVVARGTHNNVKKAKLAILDFLAFLVPGEFSKVKLPKAMHGTVGKTSALIDVAAITGATVSLDRDLSMIIVQSAEKDRAWEATKLVQSNVAEAEKLVFAFEFDTSDAWLIPMLIGTKGGRINAIRKASGCVIEIDKESRTVVLTGITEESVATAKTSIQGNIDKAKKENVWIALPADAVPRFVGKGGAHIAGLRKKYEVEIETLKRGSQLRVTGDDESKVAEAKEVIEAWIADYSKSEEKNGIQIERHHISVIIGKGGANIQALQDECGCRIDLDRDSLFVSFRGDPAKQEIAQKKIEEIMAENLAPEPKEKSKGEADGEKEDQPVKAPRGELKKTKDDKDKKDAAEGDPDEQVDRTMEFKKVPIGISPGKKKRSRNRNKNKKAGVTLAATTPTKPIGASSGEESSLSDEDDNIVASDPAAGGPLFVDRIVNA